LSRGDDDSKKGRCALALGTPVEFILSLGWLIVVALLIRRALRQRALLRSLDPVSAPPEAPRVKVVVPARDEAANIARCLEGLIQQSYPAFEVCVVDDGSSDATPQIVAAFADRDQRLRLLSAPSLPQGWIGKCHACWIGAHADGESDWLCFIDADVFAGPMLLASAIDTTVRDNLDLLSLAPRHELKSFAERLVLPCGLYLLAFTQDLGRIHESGDPEVNATGQFILIRTEVYEALGGHAAVRDAICEDVALARVAKHSGRRTALHGGERLLTTRMYSGWRTLWEGIARNLVQMLGGPARSMVMVSVGLMLAWAAVFLPMADAIRCDRGVSIACAGLMLALPASAAAFGLHVAGTGYFHIPFWYGALFPLGYTVGACMAIDSVRRHLTGRVTWKGRTYDERARSREQAG
jgi:chlorobactene glucosyltransferase